MKKQELIDKKKTSILINSKLWSKFKIYSIKVKMEMGEILNFLIKRELKTKSVIRGDGDRDGKI